MNTQDHDVLRQVAASTSCSRAAPIYASSPTQAPSSYSHVHRVVTFQPSDITILTAGAGAGAGAAKPKSKQMDTASSAVDQETEVIEPLSLSDAAAKIFRMTSLSNDAFFVTEFLHDAAQGDMMKNVYISPSVVKWIGYTPEELFGRRVRSASGQASTLTPSLRRRVPLEASVHPDDLKKIHAIVKLEKDRAIFRRGLTDKNARDHIELQAFCYRRRRKDGTWADLEIAGATDVRPASTAALVRLATRILS